MDTVSSAKDQVCEKEVALRLSCVVRCPDLEKLHPARNRLLLYDTPCSINCQTRRLISCRRFVQAADTTMGSVDALKSQVGRGK